MNLFTMIWDAYYPFASMITWLELWSASFLCCFVYRYINRRSRSRSVSGSPVGYRRHARSRSHSRSRSQSPAGERPTMSEKLRSRLGPQGGGNMSYTERLTSRSRSLTPIKSDDDAGPRHSRGKVSSRLPSRSASGSPPGNRRLVSYGDGSPDTGARWFAANV